MENLLNKTIKITQDIINFEETNNINFYSKILNMVSFLYPDSSLSIFFTQGANYELKAFVKEAYKPKKEEIESFLNSNKVSIEINGSFLVKLKIRNSVFGFCVLDSKELNEEIKTSFEAITNAISYKIKDYELAEVFKMQLKAMQEAVIEKQEAYEIIKTQHKKLQELDKIKTQFLANITHELRTPLNAIIGFSQALDSKIFGELNEKQAEYIKDIQVSSLHLLGMINEILDISKIEAHAIKFNPDKINPKVIIQEVVGILEPLYKNKEIEVEFISNFNGEINADYQKFRQILFNLLSNAIKFSHKKGKIEIIQEAKNKDYILKIKDNGVGIDKKYHNKIFKKFVQLDNIYCKNQSSTGLGLTITKELVKLHNGKITLESELNKGTTFIIEFKKNLP